MALDFIVTDMDADTPHGRYWVYVFGERDGWAARFQRKGRTMYECIDPPQDEDGNSQDWPTLDDARLACERHHARLVGKAAVVKVDEQIISASGGK